MLPKLQCALVLAGAMLLGVSAPWQEARAQEQSGEGQNNPPQILSADLASEQTVEADELEVNLVFVDSENIVEVTINGEPQEIRQADTVLLTRTLQLTAERNEIVVAVTDASGNTRSRTYTVYKPGAEPVLTKWDFFVRGSVAFEVDTNPTQDLSSPVDLEGLNVEGVVPDDEQPDNRTVLRISGGANNGPWNAFAGLSQTEYSKSENEDLKTNVTYLGGGYNPDLEQRGGPTVRYTFSDVNLADEDYVQLQTLSPGWRLRSSGEDGVSKHLFALDLTQKDFAAEFQDDASVYRARWVYNSLDAEGLDSYTSNLRYGTESEGFETSEYSYFGTDQDWNLRWDSGFLMNTGFGLEYREYPEDDPLSEDTPLGAERVDVPFRFSIGAGYEFLRGVSAVANYRYLTNVSNTSPYVRDIYGITVQGSF